MIKRIISGGQVGADIAGLRAGMRLGLETGGWAPKGYRTLNGSNIILKDLYGLDEHESREYPPRTYNNVADADVTARFAYNFDSRGERCTWKAIQFHKKSFIDVRIEFGKEGPTTYVSTDFFSEWVNKHEVLNVTGNADPRIELVVYNFLVEALSNNVGTS